MRASLIVVVLLLAAPLVAHAGTPADALSRCLAENTSGKDRTTLVRWMFLAMAVHPRTKEYAKADAAHARERADQAMAVLMARLLTESCVEQTRAVSKSGGKALENAFAALGALAVTEIMSNPTVSAAVKGFTTHIDDARLTQVLQE